MERNITAQIVLPMEIIQQALKGIVPIDRCTAMVERLGEACSFVQASREINCSQSTIKAMVEDGRILTACEGTRVDVRSLCDYIENRGEMDTMARRLRKDWRQKHAVV